MLVWDRIQAIEWLLLAALTLVCEKQWKVLQKDKKKTYNLARKEDSFKLQQDR